MSVSNTQFFCDGIRRIDYILVFDSSEENQFRETFFQNLTKNHIDIEFENSLEDPDIIFVKVHATSFALYRYVNIYHIPVKSAQKTYIPEPMPLFHFMYTDITDMKTYHPLYHRVRNSLLYGIPNDFTTAERSFITFHAMKRIDFSDEPFTGGILQLLHMGSFLDAYPLHDSLTEWPYEENLTERHLLARYWAHIKMWYKAQPMDTIERYFGSEVGLYFSWLEFYTMMLAIASLMGILVTLYGVLSLFLFHHTSLDEVCSSKLILCPTCRKCKPHYLEESCSKYKLAYIFDNPATLVFALGISLWATTFMELWKRKQAVLALRWNLYDIVDDIDIRPEFHAEAHHVRKTTFGEREQYIPRSKLFVRYSFGITLVILLIILVLAVILGILVYKITLIRILGEKNITPLYATVSAAIITTISMTVLRKMYEGIAIKLTNMEIPKTQKEFDKSYIFKIFSFTFVNSYGVLIYLSFFKGKFYTHPEDMDVEQIGFVLANDQCDPSGCESEVFIFLIFIMTIKPLIDNTFEIIIPMIKVWWRKRKALKSAETDTLPRWEQDYHLSPSTHFQLVGEYEEMVTQFGFVTMFAVAFPLAPLFALINNIFEIRIDAYKMTHKTRRCCVKCVSNIGAWLDLLQIITYFSIFTNAIFIAFTSEFITRLVYMIENHDIKGYINFTLSEYSPKNVYLDNKRVSECWYAAHRYPTGHEREYEHTDVYFYILAMKFAFVIIFENLVMAVTGLLAYAIPDIPRSVREKLAYDARMLRKAEKT